MMTRRVEVLIELYLDDDGQIRQSADDTLFGVQVPMHGIGDALLIDVDVEYREGVSRCVIGSMQMEESRTQLSEPLRNAVIMQHTDNIEYCALDKYCDGCELEDMYDWETELRYRPTEYGIWSTM